MRAAGRRLDRERVVDHECRSSSRARRRSDAASAHTSASVAVSGSSQTARWHAGSRHHGPPICGGVAPRPYCDDRTAVTVGSANAGRSGRAPSGWSQQAAARASAKRYERRHLGGAAVERVRAPRMEAAAARRTGRVRDLSGQRLGQEAASRRGAAPRRSALRVYGCSGSSQSGASARSRRSARGTSPQTRVGDVAHDGEVVRDQQQPELRGRARGRRAGWRAAPGPRRRATRAARRARSPTDRPPARARSRSAGAGRR